MSVEGYVGYWASGKTLALCRECVELQRRDPGLIVFNNFGYLGPNSVHIGSIDEVIAVACAEFDGHRKLIAIDEIGGLMRARGFSTWPPAADVVFQQGRKLGLEVRWTTQHWRFLDVNVRRVTERVTECKGYFLKRLSKRGVYPIVKRPRMFRERSYMAPNPEAGELPAKCDHVAWRFFHQATAELYDTLKLVETLQVVLRQQQAESASLPAVLQGLALTRLQTDADVCGS